MTRAFLGLLVAATLATAAPVEIAPIPAALVQAMQGRHVMLFGEVHDNLAQQELRAAVLRQLVVRGARPVAGA